MDQESKKDKATVDHILETLHAMDPIERTVVLAQLSWDMKVAPYVEIVKARLRTDSKFSCYFPGNRACTQYLILMALYKHFKDLPGYKAHIKDGFCCFPYRKLAIQRDE